MAHAEHRMDAEAFLAAARESVVLDVRSPSEHAQGHLPGAMSFPLFLDEERAVVGKTYKQVGQTEAIETGLGIVGPKLQALANRARELFDAQDSPKPLAALLLAGWHAFWKRRLAASNCRHPHRAVRWRIQGVPKPFQPRARSASPVRRGGGHDGFCQNRCPPCSAQPGGTCVGFGRTGQALWVGVWQP